MSYEKRFLKAIVVFVLLSFSVIVSVEAQASWVVWSYTYGGTDYDSASCVIQMSDGGFVLAGNWLIRTDGLGNMEWNRTYDGADRFASVIEASDGGLMLAGDTRSYGAESADFWLVKTDESGNVEWNKTYGGADFDRAHSFVKTSDGGYALTGETRSHGYGNDDVWLIKTDGNGNSEWNRTYGGELDDRAYSLIELSDGGFALAGETESFGAGGDDVWFIRTNQQGVSEFPSWIIPIIFATVTLFATFFKKKLLQPRS